MRRIIALLIGACLLAAGCTITRGICDCDPSPNGWGPGVFIEPAPGHAEVGIPVKPADTVKPAEKIPAPER